MRPAFVVTPLSMNLVLRRGTPTVSFMNLNVVGLARMTNTRALARGSCSLGEIIVS